MTKEHIKKLVEDSKKILEADHEVFIQSIKNDLESFKMKTLDLITKTSS